VVQGIKEVIMLRPRHPSWFKSPWADFDFWTYGGLFLESYWNALSLIAIVVRLWIFNLQPVSFRFFSKRFVTDRSCYQMLIFELTAGLF
jgi:hypothetical protein